MCLTVVRPSLCGKFDENLTSQGLGDGCGTSLTIVRPSLCGKLDENLTSQDLGDGCGASLTVARPNLNDNLSGNLTARVFGKGREGEEIGVGKAESVKSLEDVKVDGWGRSVTVYEDLDPSQGSHGLKNKFLKIDCTDGKKDDLVALNQVTDQGMGSS